jgi:beta-1,4-galactosyltransferase 1
MLNETDKAIKAFNDAHNYHNRRPEPLYRLALIFGQQGQHEQAVNILIEAKRLTDLPVDHSFLFHEFEVWEYKLDYLLGIHAYYVNGKQEHGKTAILKLLSKGTSLPDPLYSWTRNNAKWYGIEVLPIDYAKPANSRLAVVIPYRDRRAHLDKLLPVLHSILSDSNITFEIIICEQSNHTKFNRGLLFNAAINEIRKTQLNFDYYIFHDVDMIPESSISYHYRAYPTLLASAASQFDYALPYESYFGGVISVPHEDFITINGYSNFYFGWGAEDDDIKRRFLHHSIDVYVVPAAQGRYKSLDHDRVNQEESAIVNSERYYNQPIDPQDGLTNCETFYHVETTMHKIQQPISHLWITVLVNSSNLKTENF